MKESTTPDKYDEAAERAYHILTGCRTVPEHYKTHLVSYLRSAFPPPAEDARELAVRIVGNSVQEFSRKKSIEDYAWKAAAEISRFAESRVEPWREALHKMVGYADMESWRSSSYRGTGDPDHYRIMANMGRALLSDSPAKEADR